MSYLKGKDIKTQGDCLVYCYTRRIETTRTMTIYDTDPNFNYWNEQPEGFEKW